MALERRFSFNHQICDDRKLKHGALRLPETLLLSFRLNREKTRKTEKTLRDSRKGTSQHRKTKETEMTKAELEKFKSILEAKKAELTGSLRNRDEIVIEKAPDALDEVQLAGERELAIRNLDRDSNMLRQIRRALARIADGSYGVCLHCEEDISPKRVNAVPWAAFCIKCQEQVDRHEIEVDDTADLFASAA
jgi:DnaK suppressor protein